MAKAKKFRGPEIVKEIDEALDKGLGRFLINTQSKLSVSSPVLTGRLASSWFIGKGVPDRSVASKRKGSGENGAWRKGKDEPVVGTTPYSGKITLDSDWYISNSLPYAERAAFDPGYVGRRGAGAGDWFTRIENNLADDAKKAFDFYLRKVK
jgi:hypothetical protein